MTPPTKFSIQKLNSSLWVGWPNVDGDVIRNTFVPLAFAVAPSETSTATSLLLEAADGFVRAKCNVTLKQAKVAHLDGGTGLVKGFQDYFGPSLLLVRSLEHVTRNIKKEGAKKLHKTSWWTAVQHWVAFSAFIRNDTTFHFFWHHSLAILRRHGEDAFASYMAKDSGQVLGSPPSPCHALRHALQS